MMLVAMVLLASRYTGYKNKTVALFLECGHELHRKASAGVPKRAHCRECEKAARAPKRGRSRPGV